MANATPVNEYISDKTNGHMKDVVQNPVEGVKKSNNQNLTKNNLKKSNRLNNDIFLFVFLLFFSMFYLFIYFLIFFVSGYTCQCCVF